MTTKIRGRWESLYPWLLSCAVGVFLYAHPPHITVEVFDQLASTIVSVAAVVIGFVAALMTIVIGLGQTRAIRFIRDANRYRQLLQYMRLPLISGFALAGISLVFAMEILVPSNLRWEFALWVAVIVWVGTSLYRLTTIIFNILRNET